MRSRIRVAVALLAVAVAAIALPVEAQQETASGLTLEAVQVDPAHPGPDTLCKLKVTIRNSGDKIASQLAFTVTVGGHELPVYGNQLFMVPLRPGESTDIDLYNFWSTETSRPAPAGNELDVRVELREAEWMKIEVVDEDGDEVEVWDPLGPVDGLPTSTVITLPFGS